MDRWRGAATLALLLYNGANPSAIAQGTTALHLLVKSTQFDVVFDVVFDVNGMNNRLKEMLRH